MAKAKIRLDSKGMRALLQSDAVRRAVMDRAQAVASYAQWETSEGVQIPVRVYSYTTDRAAAGVTLAHPAGLPSHAKYGVLTLAAKDAGLEVKARPPK